MIRQYWYNIAIIYARISRVKIVQDSNGVQIFTKLFKMY